MVKYDNEGTVSINLQSFNQVESNIHFVSNLRIKYCHFNPKILSKNSIFSLRFYKHVCSHTFNLPLNHQLIEFIR